MQTPNTLAFVRFTAPGFHCWIDAPEDRAYLRALHRHLFHIEVRLELFHDERDVEYHNLLDYARSCFDEENHGGKSCETMARALADMIGAKWPGRWLQVLVDEDGECGAIITQTPPSVRRRRLRKESRTSQ